MVCLAEKFCYTFYMTIWQKRLLKFSFQVVGVIIALLVIALFLYYHFYFKKDNLLKYVPQNATVYGTLRLSDQIKDKPVINNFLAKFKQNIDFPPLDFSLLNNFIAYNSAFALVPKSDGENIAFNYLLVFNLKEDSQLPADYITALKNHHLYYEVLSLKPLEKNILLISDSDKLLAEVKKIANQESPSLVNKVNVVLNLSKLDIANFGKIYINIRSLNELLSKIKDVPTELLLFSLNEEKTEQLFLGVKLNQDNLVLSDLPKDLPNQPLLMTELPKDLLFSLGFFNGQAKFNALYNRLKQVDAHYFAESDKSKQIVESIYDLDITKDLLPLFNNQAQLVKADSDYLLAVKLSGINDLNGKLVKLEQIIRTYLAVNYPIEQQKRLPDNTYVTQIVKNPDIPGFIDEEFFGLNLRSLIFENEEFVYFYTQDVLFLSNSSQRIKDLIENKNQLNIADLSSCYANNLPNLSQNLLIKTDVLHNYWLGFDYFKDIVVNEDLANNKAIWLCVE